MTATDPAVPLTSTAQMSVAQLQAGPWTREVSDRQLGILEASGGPFPPVTVLPDGRVIDGWHRVNAARALGVSSLDVVVVEVDEVEAWVLAAQANTTHRPWDQEQRRKAIRVFLLECPDWSNRRIAAIVGVHEKTVRTARRALEATAALPQLDAGKPQFRVGLDGRRRSAPAAVRPEDVHKWLAEHPRATDAEVGRSLGIPASVVAELRASGSSVDSGRRGRVLRWTLSGLALRVRRLVTGLLPARGRFGWRPR